MELIETSAASTVIALTADELSTVQNALNEILHGPEAIEEWEFSTRVGATREEATKLLDALAQMPRRA